MFELVRYITLFRTCWFGGRYGGGKTSLAVYVALQLVHQRYAARIATNVPLLGCGDALVASADYVQSLHDAVLLLDESWLELGQGVDAKRLKSWLAFLRKNNQFVLLPSVLPLARQVSVFAVERQFNLLQLGLPLWVYRWRLSTGGLTKRGAEHGRFIWWYPQRSFGYYDHEYKPSDKYYIYEFASATGA